MLKRKPLKKGSKFKTADKKCSFCGLPGHSSIHCWDKPKPGIKRSTKAIAFRSAKEAGKYSELHTAWFKDNPADRDGYRECWLQIHAWCPKKMLYEHTQLEHIYPKASGKYPELKYCLVNIKAACSYCNKLKGSNTPQQLALYFPKIALLLQTPEWKGLEAKIVQHSPRLAVQLGYSAARPI